MTDTIKITDQTREVGKKLWETIDYYFRNPPEGAMEMAVKMGAAADVEDAIGRLRAWEDLTDIQQIAFATVVVSRSLRGLVRATKIVERLDDVTAKGLIASIVLSDLGGLDSSPLDELFSDRKTLDSN